MGIIAVYIPMQAPWISLMMIKHSTWVMYSKDPEISPRAFINRMKFLLEKRWISFLPTKAPIKAPTGIQPVKIPLAV